MEIGNGLVPLQIKSDMGGDLINITSNILF